MTVQVIVGTQWGDEGKGKITDILAETQDIVVRFQGGNNAGHTVVVGETTFKLHLIPSGILYDTCVCMIANGVVVNPQFLFDEIETLKSKGIMVTPDRLKISSLAHVILPFHQALDLQEESKRHEQKIGTTGKGIGPCYTDKIARRGIRVQDLLNPDRLRKKIEKHRWELYLPDVEIEPVIAEYQEWGRRLKPFVVDSSLYINQAIEAGKHIIMEGAQGVMLDIDHGTYPFVTSSNTVSGGACTGVGIGPHKIDSVIGVTKAYVTRVGQGPFPTELLDETGELLRQVGGEFGTTTGRPRRCGWLDLVVLKYAVRVNGITEICLTKLDVLDGLDEIKVCTHYLTPEGKQDEFPLDLDDFSDSEPVYVTLPGWKSDTSKLTEYADLPENAKKYVQFISEFCGVKIKMISVGTRRRQTIHLIIA